MEKLFIQNRKGQKIVVIIEQPSAEPKGLAFVMHGLSGYKEEPHIQLIAQTFLENGYTVARFDTTNTFGESDGDYENATLTNYYEDLEDVITWSKPQSWYQEPFCLAGHSFGGICITLFAENFPKLIKGLAPASTVVSGKLSSETKEYKMKLGDWQKTGWFVKHSVSRAGVVKRLPWSHMEDRLKYNLLDKISTLTMPVLMVVGSEDESTPPEHQEILFNALPSASKEFHIIQGADHVFRPHLDTHLKELKQIFDQWIKKLDK